MGRQFVDGYANLRVEDSLVSLSLTDRGAAKADAQVIDVVIRRNDLLNLLCALTAELRAHESNLAHERHVTDTPASPEFSVGANDVTIERKTSEQTADRNRPSSRSAAPFKSPPMPPRHCGAHATLRDADEALRIEATKKTG